MLSTLKLILVRMAATGFKALMTRTILVFVLRLYARSTDTKVDDQSVDLIEALLKNDVAKTRDAAMRVAETWVSERDLRNAKEAKRPD